MTVMMNNIDSINNKNDSNESIRTTVSIIRTTVLISGQYNAGAVMTNWYVDKYEPAYSCNVYYQAVRDNVATS